MDTIKIISLTPDLWEVYRTIRLKALQEDPQAFGKSYEEEFAYPKEKWIERVSNPYNFVAIENNIPLGTMGAFISDEAGEKAANIVGVFVAKESRGKGVGSKLLSAVLTKIKEDPNIKLVKLSVNKDQEAAVRLYEKFGFKVVGEETQKMGDGNVHTESLMELAI